MKLAAPRLNDVTTDLGDPPAFRSGRPGGYPPAFVEKVRRHYPKIQPLRTPRDADEVFAVARRLAESRGWRIERADADARELEAVAVTRVLRFRDDVAVRVRSSDGQTVVDLRSASRLGRTDFGVNAERIRAFLDDLERALE